MMNAAYHIGQRLSLKKQPCTIRYIGPVAQKQGEWLGVEWDDPSRGKHNGSHDGTTYFQYRSTSPTAASFLRPKQSWDESRSFLQALREKYVSPEDATNAEVVYISGKHAEEVGLEKFAKRQAQLQGIHTLVLDHMCIRHRDFDEETETKKAIAETCANITSLDLGGNLFETWTEVASLCRLLPKLRSLTLDSNRIAVLDENSIELSGIKYLSLADTFLSSSEISTIAGACPSLEGLVIASNGFTNWESTPLPRTVRSIDLSNNSLAALSDAGDLRNLPNLHMFSLKNNQISAVTSTAAPNPQVISPTLRDLDLRGNAMNSWSMFHPLSLAFPSLNSLHVANNPLYTSLTSETDGKPLTAADGYMLTIARLPQVHTLNYSTIADKERLNAETYYLGQIAATLSRVPELGRSEILAQHPRWKALCEEYGEPTLASSSHQGANKDGVGPNSRFLALDIHLPTSTLAALPNPSQPSTNTFQLEVPKSLDTYALLGHIGKRLNIFPLALRLVWETGERDPVASTAGSGGGLEWWDSDDEEDRAADGSWVEREVDLVTGTRALGSWFESGSGRVRVELV